MAKLALISALFMYPGVCLAQEGFEADPMQACIVGPGLIHACYPGARQGGVLFGTAIHWAHHLLRIQDTEQENESTWLVQDRVSMDTAIGFRSKNGFQLSVGVDWITHQVGERTDAMGAPMNMAAGIGKTWIQSSLEIMTTSAINMSMETGLVFPSPNPSILAAPGLVRWKIGAKISANWWLLHPLLGVGLRFGEDQRFRDLIRDNGLYWDAALEFSDEDWPWGIFIEAFGITRLSEPFSSEANNYAESLMGARLKLFSCFEILLGASMGITGPGAPQIRPIVIFRLLGEKNHLGNRIDRI